MQDTADEGKFRPLVLEEGCCHIRVFGQHHAEWNLRVDQQFAGTGPEYRTHDGVNAVIAPRLAGGRCERAIDLLLVVDDTTHDAGKVLLVGLGQSLAVDFLARVEDLEKEFLTTFELVGIFNFLICFC